MKAPLRGFGSDNHSGVHPALLQAITEINVGHAPAYGTCAYSRRAKEILRGHFGEKAAIYWTLTGTASNVLSLDALTQPYQAILCAEHSHLNVDECGAPERWTGCKLLPCPTTDGKLTQESILPHLIRGGDISQYGLVNAVTRASQDVECYDRATQLEYVGGDILSLSGNQWKDVSGESK